MYLNEFLYRIFFLTLLVFTSKSYSGVYYEVRGDQTNFTCNVTQTYFYKNNGSARNISAPKNFEKFNIKFVNGMDKILHEYPARSMVALYEAFDKGTLNNNFERLSRGDRYISYRFLDGDLMRVIDLYENGFIGMRIYKDGFVVIREESQCAGLNIDYYYGPEKNKVYARFNDAKEYDFRGYDGLHIEACGIISQVKYINNKTLVNIGGKYPNQDFTVVSSGGNELSSLIGYGICYVGRVSKYKGRYQIKTD